MKTEFHHLISRVHTINMTLFFYTELGHLAEEYLWGFPPCEVTLGFPLLILPSIFPSIRVFSNKLTPHIRCPKYWSFSFSISPSSECSGLISFKTDWFDLPAVQGTLKESSPAPQFEASILLHSAFFMVQLSHLYKPE